MGETTILSEDLDYLEVFEEVLVIKRIEDEVN